jgi:hypothetical protein
MTTIQRPARWDRLQDLLSALKPGDTITIDALAADTGLLPQTVQTILHGLTRAELFLHLEDGAFLRCRLVSRARHRDGAD